MCFTVSSLSAILRFDRVTLYWKDSQRHPLSRVSSLRDWDFVGENRGVFALPQFTFGTKGCEIVSFSHVDVTGVTPS